MFYFYYQYTQNRRYYTQNNELLTINQLTPGGPGVDSWCYFSSSTGSGELNTLDKSGDHDLTGVDALAVAPVSNCFLNSCN